MLRGHPCRDLVVRRFGVGPRGLPAECSRNSLCGLIVKLLVVFLIDSILPPFANGHCWGGGFFSRGLYCFFQRSAVPPLSSLVLRCRAGEGGLKASWLVAFWLLRLACTQVNLNPEWAIIEPKIVRISRCTLPFRLPITPSAAPRAIRPRSRSEVGQRWLCILRVWGALCE